MCKNYVKKIVVLLAVIILLLPFFSTNVTAATTYTVNIKTNTYCSIVNYASGKYLNIAGATSTKKASKANVNIYAYEKNSADQLWSFSKYSGNKYYITPKANTGCRLNPYASKPSNGTNVNIYTYCKNDSTQMWTFEYVEKYNAFFIRSAYNSNLVLTATGTGNNANVTVANYSSSNTKQLWKFTSNVVTATATTSKNNNNSNTSNSNIPTSVINSFDSSLATKLSAIYTKCPNGNYWHGKKGNNLYSTNSKCTENHSVKYDPCCQNAKQAVITHKDGICSAFGCCACGGYWGANSNASKASAWSCCGYASSVFAYINGRDPKDTSDKTIKAGDLINYNKTAKNPNGHWIFVKKESGNTIYYTDANGIELNNKIRWGATISKQVLGNYSIRR